MDQHPLGGNRSFVLRRGRMTQAQARALDHIDDYRIADDGGPIDFDALFRRNAKRVVEIGTGMGDATADIAGRFPEIDFLAVEVFPPGIGHLIGLIQKNALTNVRIAQTDAVDLFQRRVPRRSLAGIHIFFPDPWPKKRHHKRRLIQPAFVAILVNALAPGGYLHLATDWADYADQMVAVLGSTSHLVRVSDDETIRVSMRPTTKFETKGLQKGHQIVDLIYRFH